MKCAGSRSMARRSWSASEIISACLRMFFSYKWQDSAETNGERHAQGHGQADDQTQIDIAEPCQGHASQHGSEGVQVRDDVSLVRLAPAVARVDMGVGVRAIGLAGNGDARHGKAQGRVTRKDSASSGLGSSARLQWFKAHFV